MLLKNGLVNYSVLLVELAHRSSDTSASGSTADPNALPTKTLALRPSSNRFEIKQVHLHSRHNLLNRKRTGKTFLTVPEE